VEGRAFKNQRSGIILGGESCLRNVNSRLGRGVGSRPGQTGFASLGTRSHGNRSSRVLIAWAVLSYPRQAILLVDDESHGDGGRHVFPTLLRSTLKLYTAPPLNAPPDTVVP
jgi:hypothetical protein